MLDKAEVAQLKKVCEKLANPVEFTLYQTEESDFGRRLEDFVNEIGRLSQGKIRTVAGRPDFVVCFNTGLSRNKLSIFI